MIVGITGHTQGVGKALADALLARNTGVLGMSRSNGLDIQDAPRIVAVSKHVDVFVNNAHFEFAQTQLLYAIAQEWANQPDKLIINMGSLSANGILPDQGKYAVYKAALDHATEQLQDNRNIKCRICILRFGYTDTPRVAHRKDVRKMHVDEVVRHLLYVIDQPSRHYLKRLDFRTQWEA